MIWLLLTGLARAEFDPACRGETQALDEQGQADFLLNYFALATSFSALHAPIPHEPGKGAISMEIAVIPPLSCERRLVLNSTKTEDTNKAPALPRPRLSFSFPMIGPLVPFGGVGYVPPLTVFDTRNVIVSGEFGLGLPLENGVQVALRYHHTMQKTVADIATPFNEGNPVYEDFYAGSAFGVDLSAGYQLERLTPYASVGFTDVSTFFWIGDTGFVGNNSTPYQSVVASLGVDANLREHLNVAAEFYTAPGYLYTGRARVGWLF